MRITITGNFGNILPIESNSYSALFHTFHSSIHSFIQSLTLSLTHSEMSYLPLFYRMWWTITGNFGNILPIDWSKSYARTLHNKVLNIGDKQVCMSFFVCACLSACIYVHVYRCRLTNSR